jgi:hypothetical protein
MQRQQIRSSNQVGWADTVNNNATFTDAWQKTEYGEFLIEDLDLAYINGQCVIESIMISGAAGQQPVAADKELIEILISDNSTFGQTSLLAVAKGFYSDALIDTNKRLACFQIRQPIAIPANGRIYFTVKCASSDALTADQATIVVSQS